MMKGVGSHIVLLFLVGISIVVGLSDDVSKKPKFLERAPEDRLTNLWAVQLADDITKSDQIDSFAKSLGFINKRQIIPNKNYYLFEHQQISQATLKRSTEDLALISTTSQTLNSHPKILWSEHQELKWRGSRSLPTDPLFPDQWHLQNTGQTDATVRVDVNIVSAWDQGMLGLGIVIAIVDDGLQYTHPDLSVQYSSVGSCNLVFDGTGNASDPQPNILYDFHGTACAGVATARNNTYCGVGSAYGAIVSGIRLLGFEGLIDADVATALTYKYQYNMIYSNSWGPYDDGASLEGPGELTSLAFEDGIVNGRGGKGSVYIWAAGNGLMNNDDCNYDGYANSPYTIAVGALDNYGEQSYYSEPCAAMLVTAPSSGLNYGITTTDLFGTDGYSSTDCTDDFGGTSSATPLVAGIIALMLQANPELGWLDIQHILVRTSRITDPTDSDWYTNGAGYHVNHKFGFGLIDATAAVNLATTWTPINQNFEYISSGVISVNQDLPHYIPNNPTASTVSSSYQISLDIPLSHVSVILHTNHTSASDLNVVLTSPAGTKSVLADLRGYWIVGVINIQSPDEAEGQLVASLATFGPVIDDTQSWTGDFAAADPIDACTPLVNSNITNGLIVLVQRGTCDYVTKASNVQAAGGIAVIVFNNVVGPPPSMGGSSTNITIPVVSVQLEEGQGLVNLIGNGSVVSGNITGMKVKDDTITIDYKNWPLSSVRNWGESSVGIWTLEITDTWDYGSSNSSNGKWITWELILYKGIYPSTNSGSTSVPSQSASDGADGIDNSGSSSSGSGLNTTFIVIPVVLGGLLILLIAAGIGYWTYVSWNKRRSDYQVL